MNPLPRFLGMALFLVLVVLAALLGAPLWQSAGTPAGAPAAATAPVAAGTPGAHPAAPARLAVFSHRATFALGLVAVALSAALLFSLFLRPTTAAETRSPFTQARQEMGTLTRLAESSAAQGAELSRERDVRRRAEEDAQLKQKLLAESLLEKIRLGRDLHDGIIQSLYAVGLTLETVRPLLKSDPVAADRRLEEVRANLNNAIRDVRGYITGLTPENLRRASFSRSVTAMFEELRAGRAAQFDIQVDDPAAAELSLEQNLEVLQIAREAISNALRHGDASLVTVRMHRGDGEVGLLIQDNGRGFDPQARTATGHGLTNMEARARQLGASLRVASERGQGTRVVLTLPTDRLPTA